MGALGQHFNKKDCWWCEEFKDETFPDPIANDEDKFIHFLLDLVDHDALTAAIVSEEHQKEISTAMATYMSRNEDQYVELEEKANRNFPKLAPKMFKKFLPMKVTFRKLKGTKYQSAIYLKPGDYVPCVSCGDLGLNFETIFDHQKKFHGLEIPKVAKLTIPETFKLKVVPFGDKEHINLANHLLRRRILGVLGYVDVGYDANRKMYGSIPERDDASNLMQFDPRGGFQVIKFVDGVLVKPHGHPEAYVSLLDAQMDSFYPERGTRVYGEYNLPPPTAAATAGTGGSGPGDDPEHAEITPLTGNKRKSRTGDLTDTSEDSESGSSSQQPEGNSTEPTS